MRNMFRRTAAILLTAALIFVMLPALGSFKAFADDDAPDVPANARFELTQTDEGVVSKATAKWDPVDGADGYYVTVYWNDMNYTNEKETSEASMDVSDTLLGEWSGGGAWYFTVSSYKNAEGGGEIRNYDAAQSETVNLQQLRVYTQDRGDDLLFYVLKDSALGAIIDTSYVKAELTYNKSDKAYHASNGDTLLAVTPDQQDNYATLEALKKAALWTPDTLSKKTITEDTVVWAAWKEELCTDGQPHSYEQIVHKATFTENGYVCAQCTKCGKESDEMMIGGLAVKTVKLDKTSYTYNGKACKPAVTVQNADGPLDPDYYEISYSNNVNAGTAKVTVTLKGDYYEGTKTLSFKIKKAANPLNVKGKTASVKYKKLKKKAQQLAASKVIKFTKKGQGKITYKEQSGSKKITVDKKTGKVTVKKGLKKGTYKVKVKVKAAGNKNYKSATKAVTFTVKVK